MWHGESIKEQMPDAAIPLSLTAYSFMKYSVLSVLTINKYSVSLMSFFLVFHYEKLKIYSKV